VFSNVRLTQEHIYYKYVGLPSLLTSAISAPIEDWLMWDAHPSICSVKVPFYYWCINNLFRKIVRDINIGYKSHTSPTVTQVKTNGYSYIPAATLVGFPLSLRDITSSLCHAIWCFPCSFLKWLRNKTVIPNIRSKSPSHDQSGMVCYSSIKIVVCAQKSRVAVIDEQFVFVALCERITNKYLIISLGSTITTSWPNFSSFWRQLSLKYLQI
jgi:hypothetical protein